jgi:hypothetical protein
MSTTYGILDFPTLVSRTDLAVVAVVEEISDARWNSKDGAPWAGTYEITAQQYRVAQMRVTDVLFANVRIGSVAASVAAGNVITVVVPGSGRIAGEQILEGAPDLSAGTISGRFDQGSTVATMLTVSGFPIDGGGPQGAWQPNNGWQGTWIVEGERAVSLDPQRSLDAATLFDAIRREHERPGSVAAPGADTTRSVLGITETTVPVEPIPSPEMPPPVVVVDVLVGDGWLVAGATSGERGAALLYGPTDLVRKGGFQAGVAGQTSPEPLTDALNASVYVDPTSKAELVLALGPADAVAYAVLDRTDKEVARVDAVPIAERATGMAVEAAIDNIGIVRALAEDGRVLAVADFR